mmetsp:Transcript_22353/g.72076  ORF Transcript_22353/g.72076 Transcript_22353/m.72076 type:complete len:504 (-) Transcript_22353:562-2073(-)
MRQLVLQFEARRHGLDESEDHHARQAGLHQRRVVVDGQRHAHRDQRLRDRLPRPLPSGRRQSRHVGRRRGDSGLLFGRLLVCRRRQRSLHSVVVRRRRRRRLSNYGLPLSVLEEGLFVLDAELAALDPACFAGGGFRDVVLGDGVERRRELVGREFVHGFLEEELGSSFLFGKVRVLVVRVGVGVEDEGGGDGLAEVGVGNAKGNDGVLAVFVGEDFVELRRCDLFAGAVDDFLDAPDDRVVALLGAGDEVPGAKEQLSLSVRQERRRVRFRVPRVACHDRRPGDAHFADAGAVVFKIGLGLSRGRVEDLTFRAGADPDGPRVPRSVRRQRIRADELRGFRHAVRFDQGRPEGRLDLLQEIRGQRRRPGPDEPQRRSRAVLEVLILQKVAVGVGYENLMNRRHRREPGDVVAVDELPVLRVVEHPGNGHRPADAQRRQQGRHEAPDVKERLHDQRVVLLRDAVVTHNRLHRRVHVPVGQRHQLRTGRRTRRVQHQRQVRRRDR